MQGEFAKRLASQSRVFFVAYKNSSASANEDAMISVCSDDRIIKVESFLHAHTHSFLPIIQVTETSNLLWLEQLQASQKPKEHHHRQEQEDTNEEMWQEWNQKQSEADVATTTIW